MKDYGEDRYVQMLADLSDNKKINKTHETILPNFLNEAILNLTTQFAEI